MSSPQIAIVTGANKGIGLETARQLAAKGFRVLVGARDDAKAKAAADTLRAEKLDAHPLVIAVDDPASVARAAAEVRASHGIVDVLVNNAGVFVEPHDSKPSALSRDVLRRTFDTNFFGLVDVTQAMLPLVLQSGAGRIVNLTSILGSLSEHSDPKGPIYGMLTVAYNASKAAVNMFTINLAHELRGTNVKVNAAHPGWVKTDMGGPNAPMDIVNGAKTSVWLATLPADGPTGGYFHMEQPIRW